MSDGHYYLDVKIVARSAGRSAVAAAAYRAGERLHDERLGVTHDYRRKQAVEHAEIVAPEHAPDFVRDREALWNEVEKVEKRKDAQLAREVVVSLPRDLSPADQVALVRRFVTDQFVSRGMVADWSLHAPKASDGKENPHAHILLTFRDLGPDGFGKKNREWNTALFTKNDRVKDKSPLLELRAVWAEYVNRALNDGGSNTRVDHRSYAERDIIRIPEPKLGYAHYLKRDKGIETRRFEEWERTRHDNRVYATRQALLGKKTFHAAHRRGVEQTEELLLKRKWPTNAPELEKRPVHLGKIGPEPPDLGIDR